MRKLVTVGAAAAMMAVASLAMSGCAAGSSGSDGATSITLLVPSYSDNTKALWEDVIAGFEKDNSDITVNLEVQSWDNINDVVTTQIQAGKAPDIMNGGPFAGFAADELLYPIDEVTSPDTLSDFQESFVEASSVDGVQYGAPLIASARALFVNNSLLSEAGVSAAPTTWDELLVAAKKISALGNGIAGYGMPLGSEEAQAEAAAWFFGAGGTFGDADAITVDGVSENLAAATFMKKMVDEGATQADAGSTDRSPLMDIFVQGKIGMQIGLPPTVGQIAEGNPDLDYSIVPIPTEDGSPVTLGIADHLMAFDNGDDAKQAAITAFFDYFFSAEVYTTWVQAEGFLPTTTSGSEALSSEEALKPFLDVLPDAEFYPSTNPKWDATNAAFKSLLGQIAQGKDPEAVLAEIQAAADAE
ncbi:MAG: extracellular solute-binding protein [Salinibacterium sp.]|nr:extracellular solute-binding protein [Salinibacterium sp.]